MFYGNVMITLTLNLLMTTIVAPPSNASIWQMGFNSVFKVLKCIHVTCLMWATIAQSVWQLATGWMVRGWNPIGE
jgi:hypothetical protein